MGYSNKWKIEESLIRIGVFSLHFNECTEGCKCDDNYVLGGTVALLMCTGRYEHVLTYWVLPTCSVIVLRGTWISLIMY